MGENHRAVDETRHLRVEAAKVRAQAIRAQLSAAITFRRMVDVELDLGRSDIAHTLLRKIQFIAEKIRAHLDEPNHVPPNQLDQLRGELAGLESEIHKTEQRLTNESRGPKPILGQ